VIKAEFSSSLLQSSVSHDHSEITLIWWFDPQETLFTMLKSCDTLYFSEFIDELKVNLFEVEIVTI